MDNQQVCGKEGCGQPTAGFKCADCGAEAKEHDPSHPCGQGQSCQPQCSGCKEAESKCSCGENKQ